MMKQKVRLNLQLILRAWLFLLLAPMGWSCAHSHHGAARVEKGSLAGEPYYFRSKTYFMGQPSLRALDELKAQGVTTIINLRTQKDVAALPFAAQAEAEKRGFTYYHFPIDPEQPFSRDTMAQIEDAFMKHHRRGEKVLVHCTKGQVTAAWFAYHVRFTHGESPAQAIGEAREVGLSRADFIQKLGDLLN